MKPFFGLSNRLASILISFFYFGFAIYTLFTEGILHLNQLRLIRLTDTSSDAFTKNGRTVSVKYNFESSSTSLFGLYEVEIAIIKVCASFLLFLVLFVGASQRSKILLRIWMMIDGIIIVLGFLSTLVSVTDYHAHNIISGTPATSFVKFILVLACCLWFFSVVLSLHEEIEFGLVVGEHGTAEKGKVRSCAYVAKKGHDGEEKCPPYYDC